ncbi:hypothetical protein LTS08_008819 [Lithohypha guttulata]|nr:hypothetical protein LTS08_008819 [Lithohypha guttulata]
MADRTTRLVTIALIIFAVLFVVASIFFTVRQYLRYHYRAKLNGVERGRGSGSGMPHDPRAQQRRDHLKSHPPASTDPHPHGPGVGVKSRYDAKPLPPPPQKPLPTASTVPRPAASTPGGSGLGLGLHPGPPTPSFDPLAPEQSHFSDDDDDEDDSKEDRKNTSKVKNWFPPKPVWASSSHMQSPLLRAGARRVLSKRPQIIETASRFSRRPSQLHWPQPRTSSETAEVPIVSTPRDLSIDLQPPPSRTLASPFEYHSRQAPGKRETVIGPGDHSLPTTHGQLSTSRALLALQGVEQRNVV